MGQLELVWGEDGRVCAGALLYFLKNLAKCFCDGLWSEEVMYATCAGAVLLPVPTALSDYTRYTSCKQTLMTAG